MAGIIVYEREKFEELLLYVALKSADDPKFGKTKLNKILYYIDFLAYGKLGVPVTGATYQHRPYGPVPKEILTARDALLERGDAEIAVVDRFGYPQERLVARRPPNLSLFSDQQVQLIDLVIRALWARSGVEVSELSHAEVGWRITKDRDEIPYETVFLSNRPVTEDDLRRGKEVYELLAAQR